jgi:ribosomal protein L11 methyltransferase
MMKQTGKQERTRIEIVLNKGAEELLPQEAYQYAGPGLWIEEKDEESVVKCYPEDVEGFLRVLHESGVRIKDFRSEKEELQDYVELTKRHFRPLRIGGLTIVSPWEKKGTGKSCIIVEPGMAFGTGRHESTKLMIKLMESLEMAGKRVLDVGCGSAILALYAAHLGARKVFAVDSDIDAVVSARRNTQLNRMSRIRLACVDARNLKGRFDVVLANLDIRTFQACATHLRTLLNNNGVLIVSGILRKERKLVPPLFESLSLIRVETKNSWCGFVFERQEADRPGGEGVLSGN